MVDLRLLRPRSLLNWLSRVWRNVEIVTTDVLPSVVGSIYRALLATEGDM